MPCFLPPFIYNSTHSLESENHRDLTQQTISEQQNEFSLSYTNTSYQSPFYLHLLSVALKLYTCRGFKTSKRSWFFSFKGFSPKQRLFRSQPPWEWPLIELEVFRSPTLSIIDSTDVSLLMLEITRCNHALKNSQVLGMHQVPSTCNASWFSFW